jgi:hypothetical protein
MKQLKSILIIVGIIALVAGSMYIGWSVAKPEKTVRQVTADIILTTLHARGFLVTETYVFDEPITIENKDGTWKDYLFGQTIEARGTMEVNLGVDLQKVKEEDVQFKLNKLVIYLPPAEIFNTSLMGRIDVSNKQGILKRLLDSDDGYNQALAELTRQAEQAAQKEDLVKKANDSAIEEVTRILGYIVKDKDVEVLIKEPSENIEK